MNSTISSFAIINRKFKTVNFFQDPPSFCKLCHTIPYVPKKITIGLPAWITFKVASESNYNFKLWKYDYFSTFQWRPHLIWSSNHKEIWICVKQVTGPFVPSFAIRMYVAFTDTLPSQHTDLSNLLNCMHTIPTKIDPDNLKGCQICNDHIDYNLHNIKVCHLSQRGIIDHNYLLYHNILRSQIHVFVHIWYFHQFLK